MPEQVVNPFEKLDPKDGFHCIFLDTPTQVRVDVVTYSCGELSNVFNIENPDEATLELIAVDNPSDKARGDARRLAIVVDAMTRFLNTGGSWTDLETAYDHISRFTRYGNLFFPGYHLVDTYLTNEGVHEHIFAADDGSGRAAFWTEAEITESGGLVGGVVEPNTTLQELREQEEEEDDGGEEEAPQEGEAGPALPPLLQHRNGAGEAG